MLQRRPQCLLLHPRYTHHGRSFLAALRETLSSRRNIRASASYRSIEERRHRRGQLIVRSLLPCCDAAPKSLINPAGKSQAAIFLCSAASVKGDCQVVLCGRPMFRRRPLTRTVQTCSPPRGRKRSVLRDDRNGRRGGDGVGERWRRSGRGRQEPLGLSRRLEPAHDLLSSAGMAMRCFCRVVDPLVATVLYAGREFRLGCRIGSELVGHQHPRQPPSLEELAHEPLRGRGVSA